MSSPPLPPNVEPPGTGDPPEVGAYQVLGRLGRGGMGTVHLGRAEDGQLVAIKIVHEELARDDEFRVRFAFEVENAQRVASFCTAQVIGQGEIGGRPYLVTEFIDGETLHQHVSRTGALAPGTLHGVAVGVAAGLAAIHAAGLVHRDLKPANVILSVSGPRVIDFGIARALDLANTPTPTDVIVGSPGWTAPEILLNRQIGTFSDIFSWACLIAYAGSGRHPYGRGDAVTMAARILHAEPDLGDLPEPLKGLVTRALSQDPGRRPTALELLLALVGAGTTQGVERAAERLFSTDWQPPVPADAGGTPLPSAPSGPSGTPVQPPYSPGTPPGGVTPLGRLVQGPTPPPGSAATPPPGPTASPLPGHDATPSPRAAATPPPAGTDPGSGGNPYAALPAAPAVPAASVRRRRRKPLIIAAAAVVLVVAGGGLAYVRSLSSPAFTAVPLGRAHPTDVGRPLHLGPADTTVGAPRCGPDEYRGRRADGRFCLVPLLVYNDGDSSIGRDLRLSPQRLPLLDTSGKQHTPVAVVDGLAPGDTTLPDGARAAGNLLYDLPSGADPESIWLFTTEPNAAKKVQAWF